MPTLSIFIISYNRHLELNRKIDFFLNNYESKIKIFIIDGTSKKLIVDEKKLNSKNIQYIHYPTEDYHLRLNQISELIKTPFAQIQNDDDYFDPKLLIKCCDLLNQSSYKEFTSCYGKTGIFSTYNGKMYLNQLFNSDKKKQNSGNNRYERLKSYFVDFPYSPAIYFSVMHAKVLKNIISIFSVSRKYYGEDIQLFAETLITSTTILSGKSIYLDDIFWLRNDSDIKKRVEFKKIRNITKGSNVYSALTQYLYDKQSEEKYLNNFFSSIYYELKINDKKEHFLENISDVFMKYYDICNQNSFKKNKFSIKKKNN